MAEPGFVCVCARAVCVCAHVFGYGVNTSQGCQVSPEKPGIWGLAEPCKALLGIWWSVLKNHGCERFGRRGPGRAELA